MKKILTTTALVGSTLLASATMSSAQVSITGQLDLGYKAQSTSNTAANSYRGFTRESQLNFGYKGKLNNGIGFNAGFSWEVDSNEDATTAAIKPRLCAGVSICWTKIIVATIAPGPANNGVPRGTRAMFLSLPSVSPRSLPVRSSNAT